MKNKFKVLIVGLLLVFGSGFSMVPQPIAAQADASDAVCDALGSAGGSCTRDANGVNSVLEVALTFLSGVAGFIAIIMLILSGLRFITSNGDPNTISSAKRSILYAVIGIVIVVLAQVIIRFVVVQSSTAPVTQAVSTPAPTPWRA